MELDGQAFARGEDGYEPARRATVWNARLPDRFPDLIVQAVTAADVQAAVLHAKDEGLSIGVRSGGHSWSANHVRDGGLLLDVSRLDGVELDAEGYSAAVGPGRKGHELCELLEAADRSFPAGHCKGVAVGGYLLQGGYGWNGRVLGPACESIVGLDLVTADGEAVHASADENADLFWAARGSGPGFFAVVTRFHLRVYDRPKVCGSSVYVYPQTVMDEVYTWLRAISPEVDRRVEVQALMSRAFPGLGIEEPAIVIASPVFADSEAEAEAALALLGTCPVRDRALVDVPYAEADLPGWYEAVMQEYPDGARYACDNMWTHATADELLPGLHAIADSMPPPTSHCLWLNWGASPEREDMAYSLEDEIYLALYGCWSDPADDERYADWPRSNMAAMADLATGIQLADENLGERAAPFASDEHMARLDHIRAERDPAGRFHPWMGRT